MFYIKERVNSFSFYIYIIYKKWVVKSGTTSYIQPYKGSFALYDRATNTRIIKNKFEYENTTYNELTCEWDSGSIYLEDNHFKNSNTNISNARKDVNRIYFKNNIFEGGQLVNGSVTEKFNNSTDTFINCTFKGLV